MYLTLETLAKMQKKTIKIADKERLLRYINALCKGLCAFSNKRWIADHEVKLHHISRVKTIFNLYYGIRGQVLHCSGEAIKNTAQIYPSGWNREFGPSWFGKSDLFEDLVFREADEITVGELYWMISVIRGRQTFHSVIEGRT